MDDFRKNNGYAFYFSFKLYFIVFEPKSPPTWSLRFTNIRNAHYESKLCVIIYNIDIMNLQSN